MTLRDGHFKELKSADILAGDLVMIREDEIFPSDVILLASSNDGLCYI